MSLGLPEFGSRGTGDARRGLWRFVQIAGLAVLAFAMVMLVMEWRSASFERASLERARLEALRIGNEAEESRRALRRNPDLLVATASVESAPATVLRDLTAVLPEGVSIPGLRIEYTPEGTARLDITVVARTAPAYDRFLGALSKSPRFADLKPGSELRPGQVRATVTATHRPAGVGR